MRVNKYYLRDILSTLNGNITYEILREHPTSGAVIIRDVTGIPIYFDYPGKIEDDDFMMDHKGMAYGSGDSYEMDDDYSRAGKFIIDTSTATFVDEMYYYAPPEQPQPIGKLVIEFNPDVKEENNE